jgi:hypothetical protein
MARELTDIQRHKAKRAGIVVSLRLKVDEAQLLHALADRDGRTMSDTLRVALHCYASTASPEKLSTTEGPLTRGGLLAGDVDPIPVFA